MKAAGIPRDQIKVDGMRVSFTDQFGRRQSRVFISDNEVEQAIEAVMSGNAEISQPDDLFDRCVEAASKVEVHKADVTFTYCKESEEVQGIVTAVFKELGLLPK